ncbi:MAG TPA: type IV pilus secretin PilQ [Gammaproteobacteria bacterium]|nr:type IV pilus secretin PilQ [Gammaproteobacteria bacterium]
MKQYAYKSLVAATLIAAFVSFAGRQAQADQTRSLTSIKTVSLPNGAVEVEMTLSQSAPKPLSFSVDKPAMIVLDLPGTSVGLSQNQQMFNVGDLTSVQVAATSNRTRVVLNLQDMTSYKTHIDGNHVYVTLGGSKNQTASNKVSAEEKTFGPKSGSSSAGSKQATGTDLTGIHFHRMPDGGGRVEIGLPGSGVSGSVNQVGNRITVHFPGASVPKKLQERLGVSDFATPVSTITARNTPNGAEVVVKGSGNFTQMAFQANKTFAVELKPLTLGQKATGPKQYKGKKLTLNFQNIPVRSVLQILADFTGKNIVVSGNVSGNITLRLHDVPWDEALHIILQTQGLAMRQSNDVIMVAPASVFAQQEQNQLEAKNQIEKLVPLSTAYIQVNYAKAAKLAALIKSQKTSLLSKRGSITTDPRTNTLIVQDTNEHIGQVRKLVHVLDVPVKQVLIESRIVIANNNFQRSLGARFGIAGVHVGPNSTIATSGNLQGTGTILNGHTGGSPGPYTMPSNLDNLLNVNLPASNPSGSVGQLAVAVLNSSFEVGLELSALQAEGKGEVVSSPHVITANQQKAHIEQGVEIPYQNAASSGATTVQFKKAVLSLDVTPQITPDNRVLMQIEVHKDSVGQTVQTANGGSVPSIDTRQVNTQVLVDNGDTVVLGGIYETTVSNTVSKVPLLGDIPLLGYLFRQKSETNNKDELLIFVTPKILADSLSQ